MINITKAINPVTDDKLIHLLTKVIISLFLVNCAIKAGTEIRADANITGTTPAEFNLKGI